MLAGLLTVTVDLPLALLWIKEEILEISLKNSVL